MFTHRAKVEAIIMISRIRSYVWFTILLLLVSRGLSAAAAAVKQVKAAGILPVVVTENEGGEVALSVLLGKERRWMRSSSILAWQKMSVWADFVGQWDPPSGSEGDQKFPEDTAAREGNEELRYCLGKVACGHPVSAEPTEEHRQAGEAYIKARLCPEWRINHPNGAVVFAIPIDPIDPAQLTQAPLVPHYEKHLYSLVPVQTLLDLIAKARAAATAGEADDAWTMRIDLPEEVVDSQERHMFGLTAMIIHLAQERGVFADILAKRGALPAVSEQENKPAAATAAKPGDLNAQIASLLLREDRQARLLAALEAQQRSIVSDLVTRHGRQADAASALPI